ncbi:hypothetical protein ACJX0J_021791 [Zea mays]
MACLIFLQRTTNIREMRVLYFTLVEIQMRPVLSPSATGYIELPENESSLKKINIDENGFHYMDFNMNMLASCMMKIESYGFNPYEFVVGGDTGLLSLLIPIGLLMAWIVMGFIGVVSIIILWFFAISNKILIRFIMVTYFQKIY